ncbi:hypothetical protein BD779DRAFT_1473439 [Infundibulicybe gibba]|nr:hypothetical protein BD779DRAFT_1473439 [Infundibulicybe gibba]
MPTSTQLPVHEHPYMRPTCEPAAPQCSTYRRGQTPNAAFLSQVVVVVFAPFGNEIIEVLRRGPDEHHSFDFVSQCVGRIGAILETCVRIRVPGVTGVLGSQGNPQIAQVLHNHQKEEMGIQREELRMQKGELQIQKGLQMQSEELKIQLDAVEAKTWGKQAKLEPRSRTQEAKLIEAKINYIDSNYRSGRAKWVRLVPRLPLITVAVNCCVRTPSRSISQIRLGAMSQVQPPADTWRRRRDPFGDRQNKIFWLRVMPRLTANGFSAWVSIDGVELPQYGVETADIDGVKTASCWIPSKVDKTFEIGWSVPSWDPKQLAS